MSQFRAEAIETSAMTVTFAVTEFDMGFSAVYNFTDRPDLGLAMNGDAGPNRYFSHAVSTFAGLEQAFSFAVVSCGIKAARPGQREERKHDAGVD